MKVFYASCVAILLVCSAIALKHEFDRIAFDRAKKYSADAHSSPPWERWTTDPLTNALADRHDCVVAAIDTASFPLSEDPILVNAIVDCDGTVCDIIVDWIGDQLVTGVRLDFRGRQQQHVAFGDEDLLRLENNRGLAKETAISWNCRSSPINSVSPQDIVAICLVGTNGSQITRVITPTIVGGSE